jgi:hypothetical protein
VQGTICSGSGSVCKKAGHLQSVAVLRLMTQDLWASAIFSCAPVCLPTLCLVPSLPPSPTPSGKAAQMPCLGCSTACEVPAHGCRTVECRKLRPSIKVPVFQLYTHIAQARLYPAFDSMTVSLGYTCWGMKCGLATCVARSYVIQLHH